VTKTWKINRAVVKVKVEGTSLPADIAGHRLQEKIGERKQGRWV
jgi:hypothetical protein